MPPQIGGSFFAPFSISLSCSGVRLSVIFFRISALVGTFLVAILLSPLERICVSVFLLPGQQAIMQLDKQLVEAFAHALAC